MSLLPSRSSLYQHRHPSLPHKLPPAASRASGKPAAPAPSGVEGAIKPTAPMPGTILDIKVNPGDKVSKGPGDYSEAKMETKYWYLRMPLLLGCNQRTTGQSAMSC